MFDVTVIKPTQYVPTHVTHEHKHAPTDESIKLAHQMSQETKDAIVARIETTNNNFHATWILIEEFQLFQVVAICKFRLNGKDYKFETILSEELFRDDKQLIRTLHKALSEYVAQTLIVNSLKDLRTARKMLTT